jgi:subtilisin family serine protease
MGAGSAVLLLVALAAGTLAAPAAAEPSPEHGSGRYIVVLKSKQSLATTAGQLRSAVSGLKIRHLYGNVVNGFSATVPHARVNALRKDPRVDFVEPDQRATGDAQVLPWGVDMVEADKSSTRAGNGAGAVALVNGYVIDSGIAKNTDLNVVQRLNFTEDPDTDCHGHGTHVAGSFGARDNASGVVGVAPGLAITSLKVLDCDTHGWYSDMIAAIDWITANAKKPAVANMSIGGSPSDALDNAVRRSVASGVFFSLSAGNKATTACNQTPARAGAGTNNGILTVAAVDLLNLEALTSNYGSCVDLWAPGVLIRSISSIGGIRTMSGTSMASPHGAGAAALYLSTHRTATPAAVEAALKKAAVTPGTRSKSGILIKRVNTSGM